MLKKRGATVLHAPTLRVFSLDDDHELKARTADVMARPPDYLLASTGFGMRTWLAAADSWGLRENLLNALRRARIANRGAKAASANESMQLAEWYRAPNERLNELVEHLLKEPLGGCRVVFQLHGMADPAAIAALVSAGAEVIEIDAYRLSLPANPAQAHGLIRAACADEVAAITFVIAPAVHNLFVLAAQIGLDGELRRAFNTRVVAACVGPVCAAGAVDEGILHPLVPTRARLVPLIQTLTDHLQKASSG